MGVPREPAATDLEALQAVDDPAPPPAPQPAEVTEAPPYDQLNGVCYKLFLFSVLLPSSLVLSVVFYNRFG